MSDIQILKEKFTATIKKLVDTTNESRKEIGAAFCKNNDDIKMIKGEICGRRWCFPPDCGKGNDILGDFHTHPSTTITNDLRNMIPSADDIWSFFQRSIENDMKVTCVGSQPGVVCYRKSDSSDAEWLTEYIKNGRPYDEGVKRVIRTSRQTFVTVDDILLFKNLRLYPLTGKGPMWNPDVGKVVPLDETKEQLKKVLQNLLQDIQEQQKYIIKDG